MWEPKKFCISRFMPLREFTISKGPYNNHHPSPTSSIHFCILHHQANHPLILFIPLKAFLDHPTFILHPSHSPFSHSLDRMWLWESIVECFCTEQYRARRMERRLEGQLYTKLEMTPLPIYSKTTMTPNESWRPDEPRHQLPRNGIIVFELLQHRNVPEIVAGSNVPYLAQLHLRVKDVSAMMVQGVHCSDENLERSYGFITEDRSYIPAWADKGWTHTRYYLLRDRSEDPQWWGTIWVWGRGMTGLRQFELGTLSTDNVLNLRAQNNRGESVYWYDHNDQESEWFNAIYDDMPMQGLWPWPRAESQNNEDNGANEDADADADTDTDAKSLIFE